MIDSRREFEEPLRGGPAPAGSDRVSRLAAAAALLATAALLVPGPPAQACPESALGTDTAWAYLWDTDYREDGDLYLLTLKLQVVDAPWSRTIVVDGQAVDAEVVHWTPISLAHWARNAALLFGGNSKFVVGAINDPATGDVAVLPWSSIKRIAIEQGDDFNDNAPFLVEIELALLHRPEPFDGERRTFDPHPSPKLFRETYVELIPNEHPEFFDPYGQSYGDYFADLEYRVSFLHGPWMNGFHPTPDDPLPLDRALLYQPDRGLVYMDRTRLTDILPEDYPRGPTAAQTGDLYAYVTATYDQLKPTVTVREMVGRQVELALMGDRSLVPHRSPYGQYRPECKFVEGRDFRVNPNSLGLLAELADRPSEVSSPWSGPATPASGLAFLPGGWLGRGLLGGALLFPLLAAFAVWRRWRTAAR